MSRTKPGDHIGVRKCKCDERLIVSRIVWLGSLGMECLAFVHGRDVATPNDPKLSDRGVRRGTCMVGGKAAAEAGAVTHGAVRCSAWLRVAVIARFKPSLQRTRALTGGASANDALNADVLVEVGPMNALSASDKPGMPSLSDGAVKEARIPRKRGGNGAPIRKLNDERIIGDINGGCLEGGGIKNQSSHASAARVVVGAAQSIGKSC